MEPGVGGEGKEERNCCCQTSRVQHECPSMRRHGEEGKVTRPDDCQHAGLWTRAQTRTVIRERAWDRSCYYARLDNSSFRGRCGFSITAQRNHARQGHMPALLPVRCVTLSKLLPLSEPEVPHLHNDDTYLHHQAAVNTNQDKSLTVTCCANSVTIIY